MKYRPLILSLSAALIGAASAQDSISVNFRRGGEVVTGTAGLEPSSNWNNVTGAGGALADPVDQSGTATAANVSWSANGTWSTGPEGGGGDDDLLRGYLDDNGAGGAHVEVTDIPYLAYDVHVSFNNDWGSGNAGFFDIDASSTNVTSANHITAGTFTQNTGVLDTGNSLTITGLSGSQMNLDSGQRTNPGVSNVTGFQIVDQTIDLDLDGVHDPFETNNGPGSYVGPTDTGTDPALADTDADGVDDGVEIAYGSDPTTPDDTDLDGLTNLEETSGSLNVAYGNAPSDPLAVDTDGDGIDDLQEINGQDGSGTPHAFGATDPTNSDSDGDLFSDPSELVIASDPNNIAIFPSISGPSQTGLNFVGGRNGGINDTNGGYVDTTLTADNSDITGLSPQANWNNLETASGVNQSLPDENGATTSMLATWSSAAKYSIEPTIDSAFIKPDDATAALMQGFVDNSTVDVSGIPYATYDVIVYFDSDTTADRVNTYSANGTEKTRVLNDGTNWDIIGGTGGIFVEGFGIGNVSNYVVFNGLTSPDLNVTATGFSGPATIQGIQIVNASTDTDGGGIPDSTELRLGLDPNDGGVDDVGDLDSDNITNLQELADGTNPNSVDTDNDFVDDDIEVIGGTDPLNPDSDFDGLTDGEEDVNSNGIVDTGETDPILADTDVDGLTDGDEVITYGTDPLIVDTDLDTISDGDEVNLYNTDPLSDDSDLDTLLDQDEINVHLTDPNSDDTDNDGLTDPVEVAGPTDPLDDDTDDDSLEDGYEVNTSLTDPVDINDPGVVANAIGINFVSNEAPDAILATAIAGQPGYLQAGWNHNYVGSWNGTEDVDIETPNIGVLTDSNTALTGVTAVWGATGDYSAWNGTANTNSVMMSGYLDNPSITFDNIPYAYYDVVVYVGNDVPGREALVELEDGTATIIGQSAFASNTQLNGFTAASYVVSTDTSGVTAGAAPANVVVFPSVSGSSCTVYVTAPVSNMGMHAIQIVESTAPVASLKITSFTQINPTQFELVWTGGDGTNNIEASTDLNAPWTPIATDVASPQIITSDPNTTPKNFFRVVEP